MTISTHKIFLVCLFLMYSFSAYTQSKTIDSLQRELQIFKDDTNKVNVLNSLTTLLLHNQSLSTVSKKSLFKKGDYSKEIQYSNTALDLSKKLAFEKGKGYAYKNLGWINHKLNNFTEALKNYHAALDVWKRESKTQNIAETYLWLSFTYYSQNSYPESLKNAYNAIGLFEKLGDKLGWANCFQSIGNIYFDQNNFSEGLKNFNEALKLRKEIGDQQGIGQTYNSMGNIYFGQGNYPEALTKFSDALEIFKKMGNDAPEWGIPWSSLNIAEVYVRQGQIADAKKNKTEATSKYSEALKSYFEALRIYVEIENEGDIIATHLLIGSLYVKLKKNPSAKKYIEKAIRLAKASESKISLRDSYMILSYLNESEGNIKDAYENYKMYIVYRDSLLNDENAKKILETKLQYEFDKKEDLAKTQQEKKNTEAKRIKNLQYFAIGGLGVIVLAVLLIATIQWRNNKQKQKANDLLTHQKKKIESTLTELKATQAQLIQSEKMASLGELTAGIAHEIQNPLNFVNNFSEVSTELVDEMNVEIEKGNTEDAKLIAQDLKQNLEKINHHGKRAGDIVKSMLQHSRSSSGLKEPTDINALADEYLRLAYHGLRAKDKSFNATMKTDFDVSIRNISIIPQDIGRVILNLITNAFYATNEKQKQGLENYEPTVTVKTQKPPLGGLGVCISVADNGNGIPQKVLD